MASTERRAIELGPALRALAAASAPGQLDPPAAMRAARRRRAAALARVGLAAVAASLALGLPLALRPASSRRLADPAAASAAASEFAEGVLAPRVATRAGLEAEIDRYIVDLWGSDWSLAPSGAGGADRGTAEAGDEL